jgi:UPF0716 protein FxsA
MLFALLAILFLVVPIAELAVILLIGQQIGVWWTIALLIADSIFGSWLARREGLGAWRRFRRALDTGRMPTTEIADGAMILLAGALMLTPGFISDIVGILLLLPPTRAIARRVLLDFVARRAAKRAADRFRAARSWPGLGRARVVDGHADVIDAEVEPDAQSEVPTPGRPGTTTTWGKPEP